MDTAHAYSALVMVNVAVQVPPIVSLWHFTNKFGANVELFSGGNGLRGPQSSELVLSKHDLIEGCRANMIITQTDD